LRKGRTEVGRFPVAVDHRRSEFELSWVGLEKVGRKNFGPKTGYLGFSVAVEHRRMRVVLEKVGLKIFSPTLILR